jgi:multiple sugar transport system permease protein
MTLNNIVRGKRRDKHSAYFKRDLISYLLLIGPPFVIIFVLTFLPVVDSIWMSLWHMNLAMPDANKFIGLGNYIKMFTIDPNFWVIMRNTVVQVFSTVILQVVIGLLLAILFSREVRGMNVARALLIVPMMVTPVVVGVIWRMALNPDYGVINYLLSLLHVAGPDWLSSPSLAMVSIVLTDVWLSTPFVTIIIIAGISSLPRDPFEAAKVDGANAFQSFFYITLPLLKPVIWVAVMFRLIDSFKRFDSIFIMTGGGPGIATETLNLYAYNTAFFYMDTGYASALASFLFIIIAVVSIFTISKVQRGGDS